MSQEQATFTFANDIKAVPRMRGFVAHWLSDAQVPEPVHSDLVLAVGEALNNACQHTSPEARAVHISCRRNARRISVSVSDHGYGFSSDHLSTDLPPLDKEGGRGLYLMRNLVDDVRIRRSDEGTRVTLSRVLARRSR